MDSYFTEGVAGGRGWLKSIDPTGEWEGLAEEHGPHWRVGGAG